jgi:hypothetical protein
LLKPPLHSEHDIINPILTRKMWFAQCSMDDKCDDSVNIIIYLLIRTNLMEIMGKVKKGLSIVPVNNYFKICTTA